MTKFDERITCVFVCVQTHSQTHALVSHLLVGSGKVF